MFKILDIKKEDQKCEDGKQPKWFYIEIHFQGDPHFGKLGKYHKSLMVADIQKYEDYYNEPENLEYETQQVAGDVSDATDVYELRFNKASPFEIGLCKIVDVVGEDVVEQQEDGSYIYRDHISDNYITRSAVNQLYEMKFQMERGFCRWGDYPEQAGAFRSGDPYHDFIGIIETLHRFWD